MKALKIVIIILVVLLAIFLVPPLFMPGELFVEHSRVLKAQPEVIWDQVNCLENWEKWDTWHQDTNMTGSYSGPACGVDAKNSWTYKNTDDGGSQTIIESREYEYIKTFLDFQEMGSAESEFFFEKVEDGTKITWNLKGNGSYPVMRWINTLLVKPGVDKAYSEGLENLDELTKDLKPPVKYSTGDISITLVESQHALAVRANVPMEDISKAMGAGFGEIMQVMEPAGVQMAGAPFAIWYIWDGDTFVFDNCIPITKKIGGTALVKYFKTYAGKVARVEHRGTYESTQYSWEALEKYIAENSLIKNGDPWETYVTDPESEPDPSKWITELYWPIK